MPPCDSQRSVCWLVPDNEIHVVLKDSLRLQDLQTAADRLEGTYVVRLFAEV